MNLTRRRATSLLTSFLSVTLITTAFVLPAPAQAKDKITWYVTNWSPFYLTRGKHKRQGINDKLIKYVHQHLPDYDIQWKNMTAKMVPEAMEKGQNLCQFDLFKTPEREKFAYFSKYPSIIDAPLRLFVLEKNENKMKLESPVDIKALINNNKYRTSFVSGRSYDTMIDETIVNSTNSRIKQNESITRIVKHFFKGKYQYMVEYSAVMNYLGNTMKNTSNMFSYPIKDTEPFVLGYVACSKTLWGKTVIEAIDGVLKDHRHTPEYKAILEEWHDERSRKVLTDNYDKF